MKYFRDSLCLQNRSEIKTNEFASSSNERKQDSADAASVAVDSALQVLPDFPAAEHLPRPIRKEVDGCFVYENDAWPKGVANCRRPISAGVKRKWPGQSDLQRKDFCLKYGLQLRSLSRAADDYLQRTHRLRAFAAEAGAGGECFFLSVAASLETLRVHLHELPSSVETLFSADASRTVVAKRLRDLVGAAVRSWSPKRFIDFVTSCLSDELAGSWLDQWKMSNVICGTPFDILDSVNAVESVAVDDAETVILQCKHGDHPIPLSHVITNGLHVLRKMQNTVAHHLCQVGNNHWATQLDVDILSKELKINFCIVGNEPVSSIPGSASGPPSVLHTYACAVEDATLYTCLYNISYQHYQALFLDLETGLQSSFLSTELPVSLTDALKITRTD